MVCPRLDARVLSAFAIVALSLGLVAAAGLRQTPEIVSGLEDTPSSSHFNGVRN